MKKILLLIAAIYLLSITGAYAQRTFAFTVGAGSSNYYGELTNNFLPQSTKANETVTIGYYMLPGLQFRLGFTHGIISGDDIAANDNGRTARGIHFRNRITEFSWVFVYELIPEKTYGRPWEKRKHFTPYVFGGIALFNHNPEARFQDNWYELQPLGTEGQFIPNSGMEPYSLRQASIPMGIGISYRFFKPISLNVEIGYRKTFTDYLDDVSTVYPDLVRLEQVSGGMAPIFSKPSNYPFETGFIRGNPDSKDGYLFTNISLGFILGK